MTRRPAEHSEIAAAQVVELVGLNQDRVQDMLLGVRSPARAPNTLQSLATVVDAAHVVWQAVPAPPDASNRLLMAQLAGRARALHDSIARVDWPLPLRVDDRLGAIADTFTDVAGVLRSHPQALDALEAERVRTAVATTVHLSAHLARVTAFRYSAEAGGPTGSRSYHHRRPHLKLMNEAVDRLADFEDVSGAVIGMRASRAFPATSVERGLAAALAGWEVHSYRALVRQPSAMNLMVSALTEARIGHLAAAVFSAQAVVSHADLDDVAARLVEPLAEATASWRDLAGRWRSLLVGGLPAQLDPHLATASHRVRGITDQLLDAAAPGKAGPAYALAFRVDLPQACPMLRNALAHAADAARVTRDLAAASVSPIVGPARVLERQAVELAGDDIAWADPRAVNRGQLVPMPEPVRRHIADTCNQIAGTIRRALNTADLVDVDRESAAIRPPVRTVRDRPPPSSLSTTGERPCRAPAR